MVRDAEPWLANIEMSVGCARMGRELPIFSGADTALAGLVRRLRCGGEDVFGESSFAFPDDPDTVRRDVSLAGDPFSSLARLCIFLDDFLRRIFGRSGAGGFGAPSGNLGMVAVAVRAQSGTTYGLRFDLAGELTVRLGPECFVGE